MCGRRSPGRGDPRMTALPMRRAHVPFRVVAPVVVVGWLAAWFVNLPLANWAAYDLLGLEQGSHVGDAVAFFLLDVPKVLLLLLGIMTVVSFLRSYFPPERMRAALAGRGTVPATVGAAAFGVVTPFCSCSAVPLFIGFVEAGIPLGVTFAFLISSPMVNEVALVLLWGLFGPVVAIVGGLVIGRLHMERYVEDYVWALQGKGGALVEVKLTWEDRIHDAWAY